MSAQQPPSAAGQVPAAASGDADADADAAGLPVYDEALHRAAFQAKVQQRFDVSLMVERQSLTSAEVELLTSVVDGHSTRSAKLALGVRKVFVTPSASVHHAHTLSAQVRFSVALGWHFQCKCMRFKTLKVGLHFQCGALQQVRS